ncbi:MAG: alpha-galactosidase, partial [Muribaculaceae bacterium]|nr:alpha-galactosidase [Muribaculaceae bacterium]
MKMRVLSCLVLSCCIAAFADDCKFIRISTDATDLILKTAPGGRLYQAYLGDRLADESDMKLLPHYVHSGSDGAVGLRGWEVYPGSGAEDFFEPALAMTHHDGNRCTILRYEDSHQSPAPGGTETVITMRDDVYPVQVKLHYRAYDKENVIKVWSEISHDEPAPVSLWRYASAMLYFSDDAYWLTEFSGDHAKEAVMTDQPLQFGKKVIDTKLGSRASMFAYPFFELGLGAPVSEDHGRVLLGTIGWTGNFQFIFEVDNVGNLRVLPGINPYASEYTIRPGEVFTTPEFIFTLSDCGTGQASRNLHQWARSWQLKDGLGDRMTLLNNWENTYFKFNEKLLRQLMGEASRLGVDMFLLDDGWFGNDNPRNDDRAGLGDWEPMKSKLPHGIAGLVKSAEDAGVRFGIWIEPEMVNPRSDLFEQHPDWAILLPNREPYYYRHQLVLDMSNPQVQDFVFGVVDSILTANPGVAYFKWDCNSPITNIYSPYLGADQGRMYVDHVKGLYNVLRRIEAKYPDLPMMLCSGGGARCDYEALRYFCEFWPSDNTDPLERVYIQWGFSQFFPAKSMCAHVTSKNKRTSVKFRTDVASMCKLWFDIGLADLSDDDLAYCQLAVNNWNRLKPVILDGDQYRLVSPYQTNHMAVMYVAPEAGKAVLFAYDIHPRYAEKLPRVRLQGLDPNRRYRVEEINLMPGTVSKWKE